MDAGLNSNKESFQTGTGKIELCNCNTVGMFIGLKKMLIIFLLVKITKFCEDTEAFTTLPLNYFIFTEQILISLHGKCQFAG